MFAEQLLERLTQFRLGRRGAIRCAGISAATLAASAISQSARAAAVTDTDIMNFLLNLEYLEAEYFSYAVTGHGVAAQYRTGPIGTQGQVSPGAKAQLSKAITDYAKRLAEDELGHVKFLRNLMGASVVAEPAIDISVSKNSAFTHFAIAAGLIVPGQEFNVYGDDTSFLLGASIFEDVVVTAYAGAAATLTTPVYREAVSDILAVEGHHAGAVRTLLANAGAGQAFNLISHLRSQLSTSGGGSSAEAGILIPGNSHNFVPDSASGTALRRAPAQILRILYGGPSPALFFPRGLNGRIK